MAATKTMTAAAKKGGAKKSKRKSAKKTARKKTARKKTARKAAGRKKTARKTAGRKKTARKAGGRKKTARKAGGRKKTARKKTARKAGRRKAKKAEPAGRSSGAGGAALKAVAKRAAPSTKRSKTPARRETDVSASSLWSSPGRGKFRSAAPIDVYFWPTPNGWKITIMLEECGLPYNLIPVNIGKGDQFKPDFLKISPNNRMPAIIDPDGPGGKPISVFESGAILQYLGEKTGKFYPRAPRKRVAVNEWLFWQVGGLGPMCGQAHHFRNYAPEKIPYGIDRYTNEVNRLYGVMEVRLRKVPYLAGEYSIADMAAYPWVVPYKNQGQDLDEFPALRAWFNGMKERPYVRRAIESGLEMRGRVNPDISQNKDVQKVLFGQRARL